MAHLPLLVLAALGFVFPTVAVKKNEEPCSVSCSACKDAACSERRRSQKKALTEFYSANKGAPWNVVWYQQSHEDPAKDLEALRLAGIGNRRASANSSVRNGLRSSTPCPERPNCGLTVTRNITGSNVVVFSDSVEHRETSKQLRHGQISVLYAREPERSRGPSRWEAARQVMDLTYGVRHDSNIWSPRFVWTREEACGCAVPGAAQEAA